MEEGDIVEDFEVLDQHGEPIALSSLLETGPVVLFFYPRAMTTGCTKESCHFRDLAGEFESVGASPVGVSADPVERQREFDDRNELGFPLLSDSDRELARRFGVKRLGPLPNKRATFVIGSDRRVLRVIRSELNMDSHADEALSILRQRIS